MNHHSGSARRPRASGHFTSRLAAKLVWLAFCGYTLTGLSCPQYADWQLDRMHAEHQASSERISQLTSALSLTTCNAEQQRAQGALIRELLPYCRQMAFLRQQAEAMFRSIPSGDHTRVMHELRDRIRGFLLVLISIESNCSKALSNYRSCNPADAAPLEAWYNSTEAEIPPLPGYEQEPRGPQPTPPSPPSYAPPPPGPG